MPSEPAPQIVRFGEFELDLCTGELRTGDRRTLLPDQPFRILAALIRSPGSLVTRDDLRRELWPEDTFVDFEPSLNAVIRRLRKTLGDSAEAPRYVETLPRRGYRLIPSVQQPVPENAVSSEAPAAARFDKRRIAVLAAGLVALVGAALGLRSFGVPAPRAGRTPDNAAARITRLTNLGTVRIASLSADGRSLAYVRTDETRESLWLRQPGAADTLLLPPVDGLFRSVTVGRGVVYYTLLLPDRTNVGLYRVRAAGGAQEHVADFTGPIALSGDGTRWAHISTVSFAVRESRLLIGEAGGHSDRVIAVRTPPANFATMKPAWAPGGRELAVIVENEQSPGAVELVTLDASSGRERSRMTLPLEAVDSMVWLSDGTRVFSARRRWALPARLWMMAPGSTTLRPLTDDGSDYWLAGTTPDARRAVAVRCEAAHVLWTVDLAGANLAHRLTAGCGRLNGFEGIAWLANRVVVYPALEGENLDLYSIDVKSGERRRLTIDPADDYHPTASADGTAVAFVSHRSGRAATWIMSADGSSPRRISDGIDSRPALAPDSSFAIVQRHGLENLPSTLWRVDTNGGEAVPVAMQQSFRPSVSPDGRWIAHYWMTPERWTLAVTPIASNLPAHTFAVARTHRSRVVRWSPDGKALAFIDSPDGNANIWLQPLGGRAPRALTRLTGASIEAFDWSRDGSRLAWTTLVEIGDLVTVALDARGKESEDSVRR